jgi:hypothetical protein
MKENVETELRLLHSRAQSDVYTGASYLVIASKAL